MSPRFLVEFRQSGNTDSLYLFRAQVSTLLSNSIELKTGMVLVWHIVRTADVYLCRASPNISHLLVLIQVPKT